MIKTLSTAEKIMAVIFAILTLSSMIQGYFNSKNSQAIIAITENEKEYRKLIEFRLKALEGYHNHGRPTL